jgi:membrane fusion protein (multidrug efflux system)
MNDKGFRGELASDASNVASAPAVTRLCYVDDSRTSAFVVRRLLQPYGYQVDHFLSAEPAFVALIQEDYDLLLTDLKVSSMGMDGDDLIRTLRQSGHPRISMLPIIVITGSTDAEVLVDVYNAGANQVMNKPVDADELDGHIRRLLSEQRRAGLKVVKSIPPDAVDALKPDIPVLAVTPGASDRLKSVPGADDDEPLQIGNPENAETVIGKSAPDRLAGEEWTSDELPRVRRADAKDEAIIEPDEAGDAAASILQDVNRYPLITEEWTPVASSLWQTRMRGLLLGVLLVTAAAVVGALSWNFLHNEGLPVETVRMEVGQIYQSITVSGQVLSKPRVNVTSTRTGRVVEILVEEGDQVEAGERLARLDDRELLNRLKHTQASLSNARERAVLAERVLSRLRKAHNKGAMAQSLVEDAEVDLRAAQDKVSLAVEEAHSAKLDLENQRIIAPLGGIVIVHNVEIGQWVDPSEILFTLADKIQHEIEIRVDAADSAAIDVGQVVFVSSDAFPGLEWQESVVRVGTVADNQEKSNSVKVYISLGSEAPLLRFGQQVDADIRTAWNPTALKVPVEALINRDDQTLVAVMVEGRVQLKPVETGIEDFSMTEIKQGLNEGEIIILAKGHVLQDGDRVYPARSDE